MKQKQEKTKSSDVGVTTYVRCINDCIFSKTSLSSPAVFDCLFSYAVTYPTHKSVIFLSLNVEPFSI